MGTGATDDAAPGGDLVAQLLQSPPQWDRFNGALQPHRVELPSHILDKLTPAELEIWAKRLAVAADISSDSSPQSACFLHLNAAHIYRSINRIQEAVCQEVHALALQQLLADGPQVAAIAHRLTDDLAGQSPMAVGVEAGIVEQIGLAMLNWGDIPAALTQFTRADALFAECSSDGAISPGGEDFSRGRLMNQCRIAYCEGLLPGKRFRERSLKTLRTYFERQALRSWLVDAGACLLLQIKLCLQHGKFSQAARLMGKYQSMFASTAGLWERVEYGLLRACVLRGTGRHKEAGEIALATYADAESLGFKVSVLNSVEDEPLIDPPALLGRDHKDTERLSRKLGRGPFPLTANTIETVRDGLQNRRVQREGLGAQEIVYVELLLDGKFTGPTPMSISDAIKLRDSLLSQPLVRVVDELQTKYTLTDRQGSGKTCHLSNLSKTEADLFWFLGSGIEKGEITVGMLTATMRALGHTITDPNYASVSMNRLRKALAEDIASAAICVRRHGAYKINQSGWTSLEIRRRLNRKKSRLLECHSTY